jgi:hypothetical protein
VNAPRRLVAVLCLLGTVLAVWPARAHAPSTAQLRLERSTRGLAIRWDIAVRDLDAIARLDADADGAVTWGEIRARERDLRALARARLTLRDAGTGASLPLADGGPLALADHADGPYLVVRMAAPAAPRVEIAYALLFDVDALHTCLVRTESAGRATTRVLTRAAPTHVADFGDAGALSTLGAMIGAGIDHIARGTDHLLFLVTLLLPCVLLWSDGRWRPTPSLRQALVECVKVVTAFTVAHAVTLSAAVLGALAVPPRLVESAIAASIVIVAADNLRPVLRGDRSVAALGLGLLHGLGFSSALREIGLPRDDLALSLLGFNLGVEVGQIAVVAVVVPLAFALRATSFYRGPGLFGGSVAALSIGLAWLAERALGLTWLR